MNNKFRRVLTTSTAWVILILLLSTWTVPRAIAAPDEPSNERVSWYMSSYSVYTNATQVILYMTNLMGWSPPSATWKSPTGATIQPACDGSPNTIREYIYASGSLVEVRDHFYIRACNRPPGQYRVIVGTEVDRTFKINPFLSYFPLVVR